MPKAKAKLGSSVSLKCRQYHSQTSKTHSQAAGQSSTTCSKQRTIYASISRRIKDIGIYFPNVEFKCPEPNDRGQPLTGDTSINVLQELLIDLQLKGADLSTCSAEEVLNKGPQAKLQTRLNILDNSLGEILEVVNFQQDSCCMLKKSYERLHESLKNYSSYHLPMPLQWAFDALISFVGEALQESYHKYMESSQMHGKLVHFLKLILNEICLHEGGTEKWLREVRSSSVSEKLSFKLNTEVSHVSSTSRHLTTESDEDHPQSNDVLFKSHPDLLGSMKSRQWKEMTHTSTDESDYPDNKLNYFFYPLIVEVKTAFSEIHHGMTEMNPLVSSSHEMDSSGEYESKLSVHSHKSEKGTAPKVENSSELHVSTGPEVLSSDEDDQAFENLQTQGHITYTRLDQLRTQHFIELMSALKNDSVKFSDSSPVKAFGLYIVMNRVYVTCLTVASEKRISDIKKYKFINGITQDRRLKYRLICSKWLNLFRRSHLIVLMRWINFLFYHEYKFMNTIINVLDED